MKCYSSDGKKPAKHYKLKLVSSFISVMQAFPAFELDKIKEIKRCCETKFYRYEKAKQNK